MRIADKSVSNVHSYIKICGKILILEDNNSKFGTLVKIHKPAQLLSRYDFDGNDFSRSYKYNSTIL
jgi:hypothetical protein